MTHICRLGIWVLVLAVGLVLANSASAGDGGAPSYPRIWYWAPAIGRANADIHGPYLNVYAPDRHPEVPPTYIALRFPRRPPIAAPAATIIPVPIPPPTSRAR
jgi:hypothetical protein